MSRVPDRTAPHFSHPAHFAQRGTDDQLRLRSRLNLLHGYPRSDFLQHEAFSFFQPYGYRFHAAAKSPEAWRKNVPELEKVFKIAPIAPSLEDVFIRVSEVK